MNAAVTTVGMTRNKDRFDWSGGHPALDFVNTLDERPLPNPIENLATYSDLVRFTELAGLIAPAQARVLRRLSGAAPRRTVRRARKLREELFAALSLLRGRKPIPPAALKGIASAIRQAHAARTLSISRNGYVAKCDWISPQALDVPLHACALAVEDLLIEADRSRIRKCGAPDCEVYFIDTSKARRRHWCSMDNCGNREKQRRWRARAD
jgi:predicted RNA-binding Zn ribbon-like protein